MDLRVRHANAVQLKRAIARALCVEAFRRAKSERPGLIRDWLPAFLQTASDQFPELGNVKRTALYRWDQAYNGLSDLGSLIDTRGGNRAVLAFRDQLIEQL